MATLEPSSWSIVWWENRDVILQALVAKRGTHSTLQSVLSSLHVDIHNLLRLPTETYNEIMFNMKRLLPLSLVVIFSVVGVPRCASALTPEEFFFRDCMSWNYAFADGSKKCTCFASRLAQSADVVAESRDAFLQKRPMS